MAELVVAPFLEPFEDRMEPAVGVPLELAIDGDVAGVADLLREIGRVEDEFRPEERVFLDLGEEAEVDADPEILQRVVDEAGVPRFVATYEPEQIADVGILGAFAHFGVEHASGEFGGDGTDQKVPELLVEIRGKPGNIRVEFLVADEMTLVRVGAQFLDQQVPLRTNRADVGPVELLEIGRVEARIEKRVLLGEAGRLER